MFLSYYWFVWCLFSDEIQKFLEEVKSLGYKEKPKYEVLACILRTGLKAIHAKDDGRLEFTPHPTPTMVRVHMHMDTHMLFCSAGNLPSPLGDFCALSLLMSVKLQRFLVNLELILASDACLSQNFLNSSKDELKHSIRR